MISYYQKTITTRRLKTLEEFKVGSWVFLEDPIEDELVKLSEDLKLDRGILADALDPYEVPRVEVDQGTVYIFTRIPFEEEGKIATVPVLLGVAPEFVFTITRKKLPFFERFIDGRVEFNTTQKIRFMLKILSEIDTAYGRFVTMINREVRRVMARIEAEIDNRDIVRFVYFETVLNDLLDALVPTNAALQKLLSGKLLTLYEEDKNFVEDVALSNGQMIELCRANLRALMNIRSAYSTLMTNNLNRTIQILTGLTIVLVIPMIIVSAYGMNVPLPFQESEHAFGIIMLMTAAATAIAVWYFTRKRWL